MGGERSVHVKLITHEPGQIITLCHDVCTRADHGVTLYTVREPPRSRDNITSMRYNVCGYDTRTHLIQ